MAARPSLQGQARAGPVGAPAPRAAAAGPFTPSFDAVASGSTAISTAHCNLAKLPSFPSCGCIDSWCRTLLTLRAETATLLQPAVALPSETQRYFLGCGPSDARSREGSTTAVPVRYHQQVSQVALTIPCCPDSSYGGIIQSAEECPSPSWDLPVCPTP